MNWMVPDELDLDDALGQAIGEAMAPERADASEFARGVQERIDRASRMNRGLARTAAALLPPILLPKGIAQGATFIGGTAFKGAGWKAVPGIAALPALAILMVLWTFVVGVRRAVTSQAQTSKPKKAQQEVSAWWGRYLLHVVGACLVLVLLAWLAPVEAVALFVVLSMVSLVGIYGALAKAGLATRREVGYRMGSFLMGLVVWGQIVGDMVGMVSPDQIWTLGLPILLVVGGATCMILGALDSGEKGREWWRVWMYALLAVLISVACAGRWMSSKRTISTEEVREYVERSFLETKPSGSHLNQTCSVVLHLQAIGGSQPDLSGFQHGFRTWLDGEWQTEGDVNPLYLTEAEGLGLLNDGDYLRLRDEYRMERLVKDSRPLRSPEHDVLQVVIRDRERGLSGGERNHIANRVVAGVQPVGNHGCLEDLYWRWQILERIGKPEHVDRLAAAVRENLLATWAVQTNGELACFAPGSASLLPSERIARPLKHLTFVWLDSTDFAVRLMARFGVPEQVDLVQLSAYLEKMGQHYGFKDPSAYEAQAGALHERVTGFPGWRSVAPDPIWTTLLNLRMLLYGSALILFCVFVTWRAPRSPIPLEQTAGI
ncbi:MAG: hypothetical protein KDB61_01555 [Planctomycetes bacterium]|nr:hypothetical protein [Planctomycetota bacterium]